MIEYGVRRPEVTSGTAATPLTYVTSVRRYDFDAGHLVSIPRGRYDGMLSGGCCAGGTARTNTTPLSSWSKRSTAATTRARPTPVTVWRTASTASSYHPELARDPSLNDGKGTLDFVRYAINLAERSNFWIASQRDLYQRMERLRGPRLPGERRRQRSHGRPTDAAAHRAHDRGQRQPFGSVLDRARRS
jgi:hypothetical protein